MVPNRIGLDSPPHPVRGHISLSVLTVGAGLSYGSICANNNAPQLQLVSFREIGCFDFLIQTLYQFHFSTSSIWRSGEVSIRIGLDSPPHSVRGHISLSVLTVGAVLLYGTFCASNNAPQLQLVSFRENGCFDFLIQTLYQFHLVVRGGHHQDWFGLTAAPGLGAHKLIRADCWYVSNGIDSGSPL